MNGSLPPANSWNPATPCDTPSDNPSIVAGITITGVPATIISAASGFYVWSITLNDGGAPPNFTVDHYDSAGNLIDHPIEVSGVDGSIIFNDPVYLSRDPLLPMEAATKEYVDAAAAAVIFPDAPSDGTNYVRNDAAWVPMGGPYLPTAGGYLTGAIGFNGAAQQRFIAGFTTGNAYRWQMNLGDNSAESGGAVGSNFTLVSYNDLGQQPTTQLTITRTGQWIVPGAFQVTGQIQLASPANLQIGGGSNGDVLITNGLGQLLWGSPGSGGGVPEAPIDGNTYGRNSALWTAVPPEAPLNASTYGRSNGAWVVIPPPAIANDAPAVNQLYGRYNNGWVQVGQQFLALAGGAMTGAIVFNAAGGGRAIAGQASGAMRWALYVGDATAETGGNSGSNFAITRYSDAGAIIDTPLTISRATGLVSMPDGATVPTASPGDSSNLAASTAFVGAAVSSAGAAFVQKAGDTMTGNLAAPSLSASNGTSAPVAAASPLAADNSLSLATTAWVNARPLGDNRIINGNFAINQRGYVSGTALAAAAYGHDRWKAGTAGCNYTFTAALPDTTITITAGSLTQVIEAGMIEGGVYTLSWTGTAQARVYQGTPAGGYVSSPVTVAGLSAGIDTIVEFNPGTVVRAKLEIGSVATPFNRQSLAKTLADCQRYYQSFPSVMCEGYGAAGALTFTQLLLPVAMRATPTVTYSASTATNASNIETTNIDAQSLRAQITVTTAGNGWVVAGVTLSAEL